MVYTCQILSENIKDFQLTNSTASKFRPYIYDSNGNHLIGGLEVYEFISNSIKLITE